MLLTNPPISDIPLDDADAHILKGAVWHHEHGWLYTANQLQAAVEAAEAGGVSKAELDRLLKIDRERDQEKPSKGLKKIVDDNLKSSVVVLLADDGSGSAFVAAWGAIRAMSFEHRDTLAFTLENIAKQILSDVKEDRRHSRSAIQSSAAVS